MKKIKCVVDVETDFDKDSYSVASMGNWHYVNDPRFHCYMVSVAREDGFQWVGPPEECPWGEVFGEHVSLTGHNIFFDLAVIHRMHELGLIPKPVYADVFDTSSMVVYLGAPRSLAGASEFLLKKPMSKDMRAYMSGKKWEELSEEKKEAMREYALLDSVNCLDLRLQFEDQWPEHEQWLAAWTANIPVRGIPVDVEAVNAGVKTLSEQRTLALDNIPWYPEEKPLSLNPLRERCEEIGIPAPKSMAKDSEEFQEWLDMYAPQVPFVEHVRNYRRLNTFCSALETVQRKLRGNLFCGELKYFGAGTTGRWGGAGGFNLQNGAKEEVFGVNMRKIIKAPDGFKFLVFDLAQIEPRCLAVMAGQKGLLGAIRAGYGIYEAFARANLGWTGGDLKKENGVLYRLAKALVLLIGYGGGEVKFAVTAKTMAGLDVIDLQTEQDKLNRYFCPRLKREYTPSEVVARRLVKLGRKASPEITADDTGFWDRLENHLASVAGTGKTCEFELPSGRLLRYFDVRRMVLEPKKPKKGEAPKPPGKPQLTAITIDSKSGKMARRKLYGGLLTENCTQAVARDVLAWHKRKVEDAGIPVLFSVHDELVTMVPDSDVDAAYKTIEGIMSTAPDWMPSLPVAAEGMIVERYTK